MALAVLGCLVVAALVVLGVRALNAPEPRPPQPRPVPAPSTVTTSPAATPTVYIECRADRCGTVFVRVPGGDVLLDRELLRGEQASFTEPKLDVVLADASALRVEVNGVPRPPGEPGERQAFIAERKG
ncbi:hypothetical protein DP939_01430 [Spongiactinospora rosea]|uniref:DUF4115 domain-containing protein n=1 Tax=Spongiactinospora rosea TaxID=2248750 RepID=A0A366M732_9ACTN|nr:hypothetical protein DP939_01430 [Spongiactinospora rosea]